MDGRRNAVFALFLLAGILCAQTPDQKLRCLLLQYKTALDRKAYDAAALACAAAVRLAPASKDTQDCATALRNADQVNPVVNTGKALLGAGEFDSALELCTTALVLNPMDKDAQECAGLARTKIVTRGQEQ